MMSDLMRKMLAIVVVLIVSVGMFAQGNDNRRPPKPGDKVVEKPKPTPKPPPSSNQNQGGDKKKKP